MKAVEPNNDDPPRGVLGGVVWNAVAVNLEQVTAFVAFVVVARILGPAEFGIVVLSVAVVEILLPLVRNGAAEGIIRSQSLDRERIGSAIWTNLAIALFLAGAVVVAAPFAAAGFGVARIESYMTVLAIVLPIAALSSIAEAVLARKMAFKLIAQRMVVAGVAGTIVAISLAALGFGAWAIIAQKITIITLGCFLNFRAARIVPPLAYCRSSAKELAKYGVGVALTNMLYRLGPRSIELLIGSLLSPASVGVYRVSTRLIELVAQIPLQPTVRVLFPVLSRMQAVPEHFGRTLLTFSGGLALVVVPVYAGLAYFADDVFRLLFDDRWAAAVPVFTVLCVAWSLRAVVTCLAPAASAAGQSGKVLALTVFDAATGVALVIAALPFGLPAVALARVAGSAVACLAYSTWLYRVVHIRPADPFIAAAPAFLTASALLATLFAVDITLQRFAGQPLGLAAGIALCAAAFVVYSRIFAGHLVHRALASAHDGLAGRASARAMAVLRL